LLLVFGLSCICLLGQLVQKGKECWRLADEKPHVSQELDHAHGNSLCLSRTNNRAYREAWAEEWAWLRHDQIGLEVLGVKRRRIQVRECHRVAVHRIGRSLLRCIASFV